MFAESGGTVRFLKRVVVPANLQVVVPVKVPESCAKKSMLLALLKNSPKVD